MLMPVYVGELSPKQRRGIMSSALAPGTALGVLVGLALNVGFERFDAGWRVMYGVQGLGGLLFAVGFVVLPYSPRYHYFVSEQGGNASQPGSWHTCD